MAAENCPTLDVWTGHFTQEPWGLSGDHVHRENDLLTRALQFSLYASSMRTMTASGAAFTPTESPSLSVNSTAASGSSGLLLLNHLTAVEAMAMDGRRRGGPLEATGRVAKRKARPSKRRPTTYINADMANFREMVQRVTGVQVGAGGEPDKASQLQPAAKTGTQPPSSGVRGPVGLPPDMQNFRLPTLDTSEFFLVGSSPAGDGSTGSGLGDALVGFEVEPSFLPVDFPTSDSWVTR